MIFKDLFRNVVSNDLGIAMLDLEQRILLHHPVDVFLLLLQLALHFVVAILSIF